MVAVAGGVVELVQHEHNRAAVARVEVDEQVEHLDLMGEVEVRGNDVAGLAVHIGARVSALAGASEVLVSSTVRDIVAGSRRRFAERGEHELKGVPDRWRLYALVRE